MTKEQCVALISAFQEASKYLAVIKLKNKRPGGATGCAVIEEISEQFDEEIQKIIDDIPEGGGGGGGGGSVTVDDALSGESKNPVQNKVINSALNAVTELLNSVNSALSDLVSDLQFIAEYNVTTAQEIAAYIDKGYPKPIVIKRGNDFYTSILAQKSSDTKVILRCIGSASNEFYMFTYTITNGTWASASHGLQSKLVSGTNIKTINGSSILGEGDISV